MQKQGWNQHEAAEAIGCSRQHLNRIINKVCVPSTKLCAKMETAMGQPKDTNLKACKEAYPIGNLWLQFYDKPGTFPFYTNWIPITDVSENPPFIDNLNSISGGCSTFILYSKTHGYSFLEATFFTIAGYYTKDGYIFNPYFDTEDAYEPKETIERRLNFLSNPYENCAPTITDAHNLIKKAIEVFNKQNNTDYIPCFSAVECQIMEETK